MQKTILRLGRQEHTQEVRQIATSHKNTHTHNIIVEVQTLCHVLRVCYMSYAIYSSPIYTCIYSSSCNVVFSLRCRYKASSVVKPPPRYIMLTLKPRARRTSSACRLSHHQVPPPRPVPPPHSNPRAIISLETYFSLDSTTQRLPPPWQVKNKKKIQMMKLEDVCVPRLSSFLYIWKHPRCGHAHTSGDFAIYRVHGRVAGKAFAICSERGNLWFPVERDCPSLCVLECAMRRAGHQLRDTQHCCNKTHKTVVFFWTPGRDTRHAPPPVHTRSPKTTTPHGLSAAPLRLSQRSPAGGEGYACKKSSCLF